MRLRNIKLSGFKSFVDPTTLVVPGNLAGIVGPNGCGKSNIIDAVTWVMGESSAKHLRGDALTDVIFNGSGARQPVGQASVELNFENTEGKLGGQYASYNEISIKRTMNREGISHYYLNGARCRRKDITGIFLGTGLGPRSYAIIEQGTISRLIDAKPEELRTFIEEAAGISKFRERRRETENRIRHTRDNIDRLNDIREELGKQLERLKRQARAAERYKVLKEEERQLRAELLALNWKELKEQTEQHDERIRERENRVEEGVARLRQVESDIEAQRVSLADINETFNEAQSAFYQAGSEISQLEQRIQHTQERIQSLQQDIEAARGAERSVSEQQQRDEAELLRLRDAVQSLEPRLQGSRSESDNAYSSLNRAEEAMQQWQTEWDTHKETLANFDRQIEVDQTRIEYLEASIEEDSARRTNLREELEQSDTDLLEQECAELKDLLDNRQLQVAEVQTTMQQRQQAVRDARVTVTQITEQLASMRTEHQQLSGKISSLEALQGAELRQQHGLTEWLSNHGFDQLPRLVQKIDVPAAWALALETVLGQRLQDLYVEDDSQFVAALDELQTGNLGVLKPGPVSPAESPRYERLLDKVSSAINLEALLGHVYVADTLEQALSIRDSLTSHESVVTPDGVWLGQTWTRINRFNQEEGGAISREQQLQALVEENEERQQAITQQESALSDAQASLEEVEAVLHESQETLQAEQHQLNELQARHAESRSKYEHRVSRKEKIEEELAELDIEDEDNRTELSSLRESVLRTQDNRNQLEHAGEHLSSSRNDHQSSLENARGLWQSTHEQSHEIALQLESFSSQRASLEQAISRSRIQINEHAARCKDLEQLLQNTQGPLPELNVQLEQKLASRVTAEKHLADTRTQMQGQENRLRELEQSRGDAEQQVQNLREQLSNTRMEAQESRVRLQTIGEQLQEQGHELQQVLGQLEEGASRETWQENLETVERKINRLGPINLAAIDEFDQLSERKEYLDKQDADLAEALETLESAIKKIDKETRTRFKETFDFLNSNLKEMFPILFGGGHAYLELTGDDLLETGVSIMARPPGKRNSTIHLLSGGEKAMTAVALVFAIFKLNPAPFCILDEVDAPLDDTNTGRFSELLKKMSEDVQFIFITHNKITMEIAGQLLGVTMYEPGVSRLVSVDVDEAVEMAASA